MHKVRVSFFLVFLALSLGLVFYPEYDLEFSSFFYFSDQGFKYESDLFVSFVFASIPFISKLFGVIYVVGLIHKVLRGKNIIKSKIFFLLLALALGPGLVVNYVLKENFGRARPREIVEFGGSKEFSRAAIIADQCASNCSFSSGHASMGYYFTAFAWIAPPMFQNIVFCMTFLFGTGVGLGRVIQGGHFLSDITFSVAVVLFVNEICYRFWVYLNNRMRDKDALKK